MSSKTVRCVAGALLACGLGVGAGVAFAAAPRVADAMSAANRVESGPVAGVTPGDWTTRWWRWALSQPIAPFEDPDGRFCGIGQDGPVWFLAGTDGSFDARRTCVVPEGKYLLVPVINMVYWQRRDRSTSCAELRAEAAVNNDRLVSAVVLLDGKPVGDLRAHRVRSDGCFRMDADDRSSQLGAADGYWVMFKPLSRGRHTLSVGANYGASKRGYGAMLQQFSYVIDIGGAALLSEAERRGRARHAGDGASRGFDSGARSADRIASR